MPLNIKRQVDYMDFLNNKPQAKYKVLCVGDEVYGDYVRSCLPENLGLMSVSDMDVNIQKPENIVLVVFTGGEDVSATVYGHHNSKDTIFSNRRDETEMRYYKWAVSNGIPMVGICRGSQFLYAMSGGTLFQHVSRHAGTRHNVMSAKHPLCQDGGNIYFVNSTHHQMADIRSKPEHVDVLAISAPPQAQYHYFWDAGVGEIVSIADVAEVESWVDNKNHALGIQWHPEMGNCPVEGRALASELIANFYTLNKRA